MNERIKKMTSDVTRFWKSRTKMQKGTMIGSVLGIIVIAIAITFMMNKTNFVPLYTDVSPSEIGRIKETLDAQAVPNEIAPGGTSILVPAEQVDALLVQLAAEGYPESGMIDYNFFSQNAGFGMTDNEFNVLKLASMQTELAKLIKGVKGVKDAQVMITLPEEGVFLSQTNETASAAIVLNTEAGYKFTDTQILSLYNLVSKSIPNLAPEDISIRNQYLEYFDLEQANANTAGANVNDQMSIKKTIERDLQRQVQTMLGTLMGQDKVVVSVTTDIDFKQENREENLVEPVDEENMAGIEISAQRISETFTGENPVAGGTPATEDATDNFTNYVEGSTSNGDYERIEDTINSEVNRIRKEIVESPYKIRDIGIQVMVEPPSPDDVTTMPEGVEQDIEQILATIIRTSIDEEAGGELTEELLQEKIVVSVQPFNGKVAAVTSTQSTIPWWVYVIGGILLVAIILLVVSLVRSRKNDEEELIILEEQREELNVDDINTEKETESTLRRKQLEKMAKDKPEEFAKLLRTWIAED
ncbi:flagellar basal-body MS-ring/collar protein FliF [Psychrobacillus psychrodurans]|uniref:flagellar basal-body MS-ring/collar protein FliF n=1 Tax=Psychrobacillus psychrodurans TaxID=126157 RepID=UPI0008E11FDE|nr:flagellar basal-body MS-ring/collar protein FliF [Psychrobacillus psychrodurans]MCZ8539532.1 flagellar M-ring protein FliF [Psychrobacillus psychrodurans]SFM41104.1 flagellar M-ring protein FliF [Psychrobacillus psychrodurans]